MKRRMCALPAIAATVIAGVVASPAMASDVFASPAAAAPGFVPVSVSLGVARARAAGIYVSPEAAAMMRDAPAGTCLADPTARKCPRTRRIVARAAAATNCRANAQPPDKSTWTEVYAYGTSTSCDSNTIYNEITTTLQRWTPYGTYETLARSVRSRSGSGNVARDARWSPCRHTDARLYRTKAVSYSKNKTGGVFTKTAYADQLLSCRPPN